MPEINTLDAEATLISFMKEMHDWEIKYYTLFEEDIQKYRMPAKEDLKIIYDKYLIKPTRLTGRLAGPNVGTPPEYNPALEFIENREIIEKTAFIFTKSETGFKNKNRYTLKFSKHNWKIQKKEWFSAYEQKWINKVF